MKMRSLECILLLALAIPLAAQEPVPTTPTPQQLIEQLGDPSFKARRSAEEALRALGEEARDVISKAAEDHDDPEVRWRAGRLLRQLDGSQEPESGLRERQPDQQPQLRLRGQGGQSGLDEMFDRMFSRLEQDFGVDVPRHRFFQDDFFKDLEQQLDELRSRSGGLAQGNAMRLNIGPDGVVLEVEEKGEDGKTDTKRYEAPDIETFRVKFPDLAKRYLDGSPVAPRFPRLDGLFPSRPLLPDWQGLPWPDLRDRLRPRGATPVAPVPPAADGPRLGIYVVEMSEDLRGYLGLGDTGLMVDRVQEGSLADRLGIRSRDIVLEVAGKPVATARDVQDALRAAGDRVVVTVKRDGESVELEAEKETPSKGLQPRKKRM